MKYKKLGNTGLEVSELCLGAMSFGHGVGKNAWKLGETQCRELVLEALKHGINFFDTANMYAEGMSEEFLGRALNDYAHRDEVVIATKVFAPMGEGPNKRGLSRKALISACEDSLQRLGTDYIDLLYIHRWDTNTPIEETLSTLNDLVRSGKVRYIAASTMYAWQLMKALSVSEQNGWPKFAAMQSQLNLLYREEEREMLPLCEDQGIAVVPWGPLSRGMLARGPDEPSQRAQSDRAFEYFAAGTPAEDRDIILSVEAIAKRHKVPMAQIALAWLSQSQAVCAPIVGITKLRQLDDAVASLDIALSPDDIAQLEAHYRPHELKAMDIPFHVETKLGIKES